MFLIVYDTPDHLVKEMKKKGGRREVKHIVSVIPYGQFASLLTIFKSGIIAMSS